MQDYISQDDLIELGVDPNDVAAVITELNDKIEQLVGDEIIDSLPEADVATLVDLQDTATDEELSEWIIERVPEYATIVQDNIDIVLGERA